MIRDIKILLALAVALWGLLGGLGNLVNYQQGMQSVESVLSMETLPEDAIPDGPREPNRLLLILGFAFIWGLKLVGGALCLVAVGPFKLYLSPLVSAVELAALFAAQIGLVMLFLHQQEN